MSSFSKSVVFGCAFALLLVPLVWGLRANSVQVDSSAESGPIERAQNRIQSGRELLSVFITSDGCGPSHDPRLPAAIIDINSALRRKVPPNSSFARIGVNLHHEIQNGLVFLNRFGNFDEIAVGGSWLNSASVTWLVRKHGSLNTPQLLLVERNVTPRQYTLDVSDDSVLVSAVGVEAISALADSLRQEKRDGNH